MQHTVPSECNSFRDLMSPRLTAAGSRSVKILWFVFIIYWRVPGIIRWFQIFYMYSVQYFSRAGSEIVYDRRDHSNDFVRAGIFWS